LSVHIEAFAAAIDFDAEKKKTKESIKSAKKYSEG